MNKKSNFHKTLTNIAGLYLKDPSSRNFVYEDRDFTFSSENSQGTIYFNVLR